MTNDTQARNPRDTEHFLAMLMQRALEDDLPEEDEPLGKITRLFLANNWSECHGGLLTRTQRIRVWPEHSPAPQAYRFEIDCPYKRKLGRDSVVELMPGPVRGGVIYRGDLFTNPQGPCLVVLIDRDLGFLHPNYSREHGYLCIGDLNELPPGPIPLDRLLENHVYPIITYQNRRPAHPADLEAARFFALDPTAMDGLEPVAPLY